MLWSLISLVRWLLLLLPAIAAVSNAQSSFNVDYLAITNNDGTVVLLGSTYCYSSVTTCATYVTVPSSYGGFPVADVVFDDHYLRDAVISQGITTCSFHNCINLTNVTIPDSVTNIGNYAFANTGLQSITLPSSVRSIGGFAFAQCPELTAVDVDPANPDYTSVDGVLFDAKLTTLVAYPGGRTGSYAIPSGVTSIGDGAFSGCSLTNIFLPASATNVGSGAFSLCKNLTTIVVDPQNGNYANLNGALWDKKRAILIQDLGEIGESYLIPSIVTTIGDSAFLGCSTLHSVSIPMSVTNIGDSAFAQCTGLQSVTIPDSVTYLGYGAFSTCASLTNASIGAGVRSIHVLCVRVLY